MPKLDPKVCTRCKVEKPRAEFPLKRGPQGNAGYIEPTCYECYLAYKRECYHKDRGTYLKRAFGITMKEYDQMLQNQNGKCAICYKEQLHKNLAVDHCHTTGEVRGLLCDMCNKALGHFGDSIENLMRAVKYLHKGKKGGNK